MYKQFWQVMEGDKVINLIFVRKSDAVSWIAQQDTPTNYWIQKRSMN